MTSGPSQRGMRPAPPLADSSAPKGSSMTAAKPVLPPTAEAGLETVRVITETLRIVTDKRLELYNGLAPLEPSSIFEGMYPA